MGERNHDGRSVRPLVLATDQIEGRASRYRKFGEAGRQFFLSADFSGENIPR